MCVRALWDVFIIRGEHPDSFRRKGRAATLFSLGRSKKKEENSPEKDDHAKSKTMEEKGDEKEPSTPEKEEGPRRRTGSFVGWVTRKGRKGGTDGGRSDTKERETGEDAVGESEHAKESGEMDEEESVGGGADWRAVMSAKR